jgi:hypothetical protein
MARLDFGVDTDGFTKLAEAMENYEGFAGDVINEVLWDSAGPMIAEAIVPLLPRSNKHWRGKKPAAASVMPFRQSNEPLSVTVRSKKQYQYLYFPDDGSTTRKHAGNMQFMLRGAEMQQDKIIELCVSKLTQIE